MLRTWRFVARFGSIRFRERRAVPSPGGPRSAGALFEKAAATHTSPLSVARPPKEVLEYPS
jgi:hypothetical protein